MSAAPQSWTTRKLLAWMSDAFKKADLDAPRVSAELLLAHVIGCDRLRLYMEADRPASEIERATLRDLVKRALDHEPVQYLTNEAWFFGLQLRVDKRVLIPRPSTDCLIEHAVEHTRANAGKAGEGVLIADIGTGSGAIAIAMLTQLSGARGIATDISPEALKVARANAETHKVIDRLDVLEGSLLEPLADHPVARDKHSLDALISNPPYIPDHEWETPGLVGRNVKGHEPELALRGGADGLDLVRPLVEGARDRLKTGGVFIVETADSTAGEVLSLVQAQPGLIAAQILKDHEGLPRAIACTAE